MTDQFGVVRRPGVAQGLVLLLPATLAVMAIIVLAPSLPQLQVQFAHAPGARWLVPIVLTAPSICMILFAPFAGWLGDRFGRRRLLLGSLLVYAGLGMAPLVLSDLTQIIVTRVGVGIAEAFSLTLSTTLLCDYFSGALRDRWLGYQTAMTAASAVVMVVAGGALGRFGWRGPFAIYAVPLVFALLIALFTWEPARVERTADASAAGLPWRPLSFIWLVSFFGSVSFYVAQVQAGAALAVAGVHEPGARGALIALSTLGTLAGTVFFRLTLAWPTARLLLSGFAALGLGYSGVAHARDAGQMTLALLVAQFGCGILLPTLLTWTQRVLPFEVRARGTGLWQGVFSSGQFFCAPIVTAASIALGGLLPAFGLFGILNVAAAGLCVTGLLVMGWNAARGDVSLN